jgi:hypothetical protein
MNVVWFNGPSVRQFLDMPRQPLEIGCNFIEQHRDVDHVCAYDRQVIDRLTKRGLNEQVSYWTRAAMASSSFQTFSSVHQCWDSGTLAVLLAHHLGVASIHILGCDWHHTNDSIFDQRYTWRRHQPKKASLAKYKLLERLHPHMSINVVTDRPWRMAVNFVSTADFLNAINC